MARREFGGWDLHAEASNDLPGYLWIQAGDPSGRYGLSGFVPSEVAVVLCRMLYDATGEARASLREVACDLPGPP